MGLDPDGQGQEGVVCHLVGGQTSGMKLMLLVLATLVLAFGLGCLNYTTAEGADHHREWARENGMPEPSRNVFFAGALATTLGAGAGGFAVGRRRRA